MAMLAVGDLGEYVFDVFKKSNGYLYPLTSDDSYHENIGNSLSFFLLTWRTHVLELFVLDMGHYRLKTEREPGQK